jgi:hypothetical protein
MYFAKLGVDIYVGTQNLGIAARDGNMGLTW